MEKKISRRSFLVKGSLALGGVALCDLEGIGSAAQKSGPKRILSEPLEERTMPHVIVKLYPGRSEQQKVQLAEAIVKDVVTIVKCGEESVSVAIEEIKPEDWADKVYKPDILNSPGQIYKKPGYSM
jgi:4-oxalocrotonate tautomerase